MARTLNQIKAWSSVLYWCDVLLKTALMHCQYLNAFHFASCYPFYYVCLFVFLQNIILYT